MALMRSSEIGGGVVRRTFQSGDERVVSGRKLTGEEIRGMRNHRPLIDKGFIDVWPEGDAGPLKRIAVKTAKGLTVVEGRDIQVLAEGLSKEEAEALITSGAATNH